MRRSLSLFNFNQHNNEFFRYWNLQTRKAIQSSWVAENTNLKLYLHRDWKCSLVELIQHTLNNTLVVLSGPNCDANVLIHSNMIFFPTVISLSMSSLTLTECRSIKQHCSLWPMAYRDTKRYLHFPRKKHVSVVPGLWKMREHEEQNEAHCKAKKKAYLT